jgi:hypothetical protein
VADNLSEMTIGVFPEFSSKTEACLGHTIDHTITIPALTEASEKEDQFLCPVRALRIYVQVTASFRRGRRLFFLPICREKEDFTAATMTNWMKGLISMVYADCGETQANLFRCVHEVRGLATSWAALNSVSMSAILKAAQWRGHSTFTSRYLKDYTFIKDKMLILGPLVVAENKI